MLNYMFVKMTVQFQGQNFFKTILKEIKTARIMESRFLLFQEQSVMLRRRNS